MLHDFLLVTKFKYILFKDFSKFTFYLLTENPKANLMHYRILLKVEATQNIKNFVVNTQLKDIKVINSMINKEFKKIDSIQEIDHMNMMALRKKSLEN